jgi:hypothetical protein
MRSGDVTVGRRVFLGLLGLGGAGIVFGAKVQRVVGDAIGSGLGGLLPGGDRFRIYSIAGGFPVIAPSRYRLVVSGLVDRPRTYTLDDLEAMDRTALVRDFHCVTGWSVPDVHWEGVRLSDILDDVGVRPGGKALSFESYDGADTESLTLEQARLSDVIVAYRMCGCTSPPCSGTNRSNGSQPSGWRTRSSLGSGSRTGTRSTAGLTGRPERATRR